MNHTLRKGQAEVIGGLIIASVLLVLIIPLTLNIISSTTTVGTRNFILRSQFEVERWSEKLTIKGAKIVNPSPVEITIVRIWRSDGTPIDIQPRNLLAGGGEIDITELGSGITSIYDLDAIVTARGRVFKIEELIPPTPEGKAPLGLTGEEIVGGSSIFSYNITVYRCIYAGSNCTADAIPAIYYNNTWYVYKNGWGTAASKGVNIDTGQANKYIDMDKNNAPELLVLRFSNNKYYVFEATDHKDYMYSVKFSNYINIKNTTTLISVFLKVVTVITAETELSVYIDTTLAKSDNYAINISNYGSLSKVRFSKDIFNVTIYEGYVLFPIQQFGHFDNVIKNYPGYYDVIISIYLKQSSSNANMSSGIEYIAVTAAYEK